MKRVLIEVPGLKHPDLDALAPILHSMGPDEVSIEGRVETLSGDVVRADRPEDLKVSTGILIAVPDDMPTLWIEKMVSHALKEAGLNLPIKRIVAIG